MKRPPNINPSYESLLSLSESFLFKWFLLGIHFSIVVVVVSVARCLLFMIVFSFSQVMSRISVCSYSKSNNNNNSNYEATTTRHNKLFATHDFSCNFEFKILHTLFSLCCCSSTRLTLNTPLTISPCPCPSLGCCPLAWPAIEAKRQQNKMLLLWPS